MFLKVISFPQIVGLLLKEFCLHNKTAWHTLKMSHERVTIIAYVGALNSSTHAVGLATSPKHLQSHYVTLVMGGNFVYLYDTEPV